MSDKKIMETVFGMHHRYDIVREKGVLFGGITYYIYRDGRRYRGAFRSLRTAVEEATRER